MHIQPGKKKRERKKSYGKVVSSTGNNEYKILFSNGEYHILKSSQLFRAPNDVTFDTNLSSASSKDINALFEVAAKEDDASVVDNLITDSNVPSSFDFNPAFESIGEVEVVDEEMNDIQVDEEIDKYEERTRVAEKELNDLVGESYAVKLSAAKNSPRMEWTVVKQHVAKPLQSRDKNMLGIKDKGFIQFLKKSKNPAGELFLYLMFGGQDEWVQNLSVMNEKIAEHNNLLSTKNRRDKRLVVPFSSKEYLTCTALLIGAADCSERGAQLWEAARHNDQNNNSSWESISEPTNFNKWVSSYRFKQYRHFVHKTWECEELKKKNSPWWRIEKAVTTFNESRKHLIQTSEIHVVDESMSAYCPQTTQKGDLPHLSYVLRKPEPLGTEFKSCACPLLKIMTCLELCRGKDEMKEQKYHMEFGSTAATTCRIAEAVNQSYSDGVREVVKGDSWFGSVKTTCEMKRRGMDGVFQVKTATKLFPKAEIQAIMEDKPGGTHVTLKGTHPESGVKLVALGYKYNCRTILYFVFTEDAGSTTNGRAYEMKFPDGNDNICIRMVNRPEVVSTFFDQVNVIDVLNHLRQKCLALEKKWVTHTGYFRIHTTLVGMNVVDTLMLCFHHNILRNQKHGISINTLINKISMEEPNDPDDVRLYSMKKFGGIVAKQLLNIADGFGIAKSVNIPLVIQQKNSGLDSLSAISHSSSFSHFNRLAYKQTENDIDELSARSNIFGLNEDNKNAIKLASYNAGCHNAREVIVSYCDALGKTHNVIKNETKYQKTNNRPYTRLKKCSYPGCEKYCRTMCADCNIAFCYPLQNMSTCDQDDICFIKHVHRITRTSLREKQIPRVTNSPSPKKRTSDGRFASPI